jgi:hypothetical protein
MQRENHRGPSRRRILKTAGAIGIGSVAAVGSATAQQKCAKTVNSHTRTEGTFAGVPAATGPLPATPFVAGAGLLAPYNTEPFTIEEGAFEGSEFTGKRIKVIMTWNPTDSGPNSANLYLDQQAITGQFEPIGYKQGESPPQGQNRIEFAVADGDEYNGTDAGGTQVNNVAVIEEGRTYRVRPQNGTGIANFEVEAKIQTFDPECTEEAEGEN